MSASLRLATGAPRHSHSLAYFATDAKEALRPLFDAAPPPDAAADAGADQAPPDGVARDRSAEAAPDVRPKDQGPAAEGGAPKKDALVPDRSPACLAPAPPTSIVAPYIIVDVKSGDDAKGDGNCVAYQTIGKALSQVSAKKRVIWVAPGTYNNEIFPLKINQQVELYGSFGSSGNPRDTKIVLPANTVPPAISITAPLSSPVTIRGFQIDTSAVKKAWAIDAKSGAITLRDVYLYGENGASFGGSALPTMVSGCRIYSSMVGLSIHSRSLGQGMVDNSSFYGSKEGIRVTAGKVRVKDCFFKKPSPAQSVKSGLTISGAVPIAEVTVERSVFEVASYAAAAISCVAGSLTARGNTFKSTGGTVITVGIQATANLGDASATGGNIFETARILLIESASQADIHALGNRWPTSAPICRIEIKTSSKPVYYASGQFCGP